MLDQQVFHARCWGWPQLVRSSNRHLRTFFDDATDHWSAYTSCLTQTNSYHWSTLRRSSATCWSARMPGRRERTAGRTCGTCPNRQDKAFVCPVHSGLSQSNRAQWHGATACKQSYWSTRGTEQAALRQRFFTRFLPRAVALSTTRQQNQERTQERNQLVAALEMLVEGR